MVNQNTLSNIGFTIREKVIELFIEELERLLEVLK